MSYGVGQNVAPYFSSREAPWYPKGFCAFHVSVALMILIDILMV